MSKLILDACCNHLGNRDIITKMIDEADKGKADYIKFQLYDSEKLNPEYPYYTETKQRLQQCELGLNDVVYIVNYCDRLAITPMFTIFDESRIDWLIKALCGKNYALKIASPDMDNHGLINKLVKSFPGKEILISCGMYNQDEIDDTRDMFSKYENVKFLYCVSMYPTPLDMINYTDMANYDGFSDHSVGLEAIKEACLVIPNLEYYEKHFTLSKNLPIVDKDWSVTPDDLPNLRAILDYNKNKIKYKERFNGKK